MSVRNLRTLNWVDAFAALLSGSIVLFFQDELVSIFGLPQDLLSLQITLSYAYALYSGFLLTKRPASKAAYQFLISANSFYSLLCLIALSFNLQRASSIGLLFLATEAVGVGLLAWAEFLALRKIAY